MGWQGGGEHYGILRVYYGMAKGKYYGMAQYKKLLQKSRKKYYGMVRKSIMGWQSEKITMKP